MIFIIEGTQHTTTFPSSRPPEIPSHHRVEPLVVLRVESLQLDPVFLRQLRVFHSLPLGQAILVTINDSHAVETLYKITQNEKMNPTIANVQGKN